MQDPSLEADDRVPPVEPTLSFGSEMSLWAKLVNGFGLLVLAILATCFVWLMSSLPRIEGRIPIKGLELPVQVARDHAGIPRITARSARDAYFAMGWIHAQDRMWQMEMQRRVGAGRLAELIGEKGLANDRFMRTLGLYRLAQANVERLEKPTRDALVAYADGVNAWLRDHSHRLPPEFVALGAHPEPWTPADSLVWGRLMSLQLTNNWRDEVLKAKLAGRIEPRRLNDLWPNYPEDAPVTLAAATADAVLAGIPEMAEPRLASNVWAVAGSRTASGKPLLANDPHLGFQAPVQWYLMTMDAPGLSLTGATIPGVPFHLIGHNGRIAWGTTTTHADSVDLFVEKLVDTDSYQTPQGTERFIRRDEIIHVKDAADEVLPVRSTRHGPVISDLTAKDLAKSGEVVAFRATALEPEDLTAQAFHKINRAIDWRSFNTALKDFHSPVQNLAFADTAGTIAFATAGRVPLRKNGDGSVPARGWTGEGDWTGWIPADKMPAQVNPKSGKLINANNKVTPDRYPYSIASAWPEAFRAQRIGEMIDAKKGLTVDDMAAMQLDQLSLAAVELKDLLGTPETKDARTAEAARMVAAWDGRASRDRPEPLIFAAWLDELWRGIFADELGDDFKSFQAVRPYVLANVLTGHRYWCDDITTAEAESCEQQSAKALERAVLSLTARHGGTMAAWKWGTDHVAVFENPVLSQVPLIGKFTRAEIATDGDDFTVNRGTYLPNSFRHMHGAGLRVVYDLADLTKSRFVIATGQSGNPLSRHYDDLMGAWRANQGVVLDRRTETKAVLRLEPGY